MPSAELMNELMSELDYRFQDTSLLASALTHPSFAGLKGKKKGTGPSAYERLEFLGDRVLGLVIAHRLFEVYGDADEGILAKRHAALVNRDALRKISLKLHLDRYIRHAQGGDIDLAQTNTAALSDAMEALIGAIYLDGGLTPAEKLIGRLWQEKINRVTVQADPKSTLQEYAQGKGLPLPVYRVIDRSGPAHAPHFVVEVEVKGLPGTKGQGASKREAEKAAAQAALDQIGSA